MKKILITGGSGLLAINWALFVRRRYQVTLLLHRRKITIPGVDTDIATLNSVKECKSVLEKHRPDVVIHTAGFTNIEECESNVSLAKSINVDLADNIAKACSQFGAKLVHISTDHLFAGDQPLMNEESTPDPVNIHWMRKFSAKTNRISR